VSETNKHRDIFLPFCTGTGLDIGFGGDAIVKNAITFDLPNRYSFVGSDIQNIEGDARDLSMFSDNCLDYVYSSHCLEDMEDTYGVLIEWLRVIKYNGYLCLLLPDEQIYRQRTHCRNIEHKHENFSMIYVLETLEKINKVKTFLKEYSIQLIHYEEHFENNDYNFSIIVQKVKE